MKTTTSRDGTTLAYEELGNGPPLVLVDGALCRREFGPMPALAPLLAKEFTVFHYDRRGRGDSGDTAPYAPEREVEDLAAIFDAAGGSAFLYGISSGAVLALRGAASGLRVKKLVVYEPPFVLDDSHRMDPPDFQERIRAMVAAGDRDGAVKLFMKVVGVPSFGIVMMRLIPKVWPNLRAAAHTLPYDFAVLGDTQQGRGLPAELRETLSAITAPTVALTGGKSPPYLNQGAKVVAETVRGATFSVVPKQNHNVAAKAIAPVLREAFAS